jgi:hypothetical protein
MVKELHQNRNPRNPSRPSPRAMEQLLADQASMILNAVGNDCQRRKSAPTFGWKRWKSGSQRGSTMTKTLDKCLKRLSDIEEEFIFMRVDLN